ncbi:hypothetical protein DPMN_075403 [Dreissena polymorpha]|uniref:Uncharacterized protein n=1 Tax=Dreissena polymorpha TaxID=45954 RepID=A0A9D4BPD5_DREPO|nr:hypothetical protein DPMN_075403 [Dreissena polymorpha]
MHYKFVLTSWIALCSMQAIKGADKGYKDDCVITTDTCTAPGTECRTETSETKCFCKTNEHWVDNEGGTGCVCDAKVHRVENAEKTECVCDAKGFWVENTGTTKACVCAPTYVLDASTCRATIGTTVCTVTGSQCSTATDSYCDATSLKCQCPAVAPVTTNVCTFTACTANDTCTSLDPNSECFGTKCRCKTGQTIGSSGKCSASPDSGAAGGVASMVLLLVCLLSAQF